jgi:hypothetical protein
MMVKKAALAFGKGAYIYPSFRLAFTGSDRAASQWAALRIHGLCACCQIPLTGAPKHWTNV